MLRLPYRAGDLPRTSAEMPHRQLDQTPPPLIYDRLVARFLSLHDTQHGPSLVSVPGARALFLDEHQPCNAASGFIRGREFAHVHPPSDGSFHMVLSPVDLEHVLERGWGELHPLAAAGQILPTVAMVFAPRDDEEIAIALAIAHASLANARK